MPSERERFEPELGLELSAVRVHTGPRAASLAGRQRSHAFAYGSHVVLGSRAQRAPPAQRTRVLAHELVHVGQQAAPAAATHSSYRARGPPALRHTPIGVQRNDDESIFGGLLEQATEFGSETLETVSELPGRAVDVVVESASAIVDTVAPGLLALLRGDATAQLTEMFCTGLDSLVGGYFKVLGEIDFMGSIEKTFRGLADGVGVLKLALGAAASEALGTLLEPLVNGLQAWSGPIVGTIREVGALINGLFSGLWTNLAVPALDFLGKVGGAVWDAFKGLVDRVWGLAKMIRDSYATAWEWLCEEFGIDWSSDSGVLATLTEYANKAWNGFLEAIEPIRRPLEIAGGVLLLLSPLGPIIVLSQVIPPLWEKVTFLWNNWNSEDILVRAREVLTKDVLPGIFGAIGGVATAMAGAAAWLGGMVAELSTAMTGVLGAFGASRCLRAVTTYFEGVSAQFARLGKWASSGFEGLAPAITAVLDALAAILRPIFEFLLRLGMLAINPGMLPVILGASIWLLCPDRLKPPVIAFVYDLLIAFIEAFPELLLMLGPLASIIKAAILGYLRHLRGGKDVTDQMRIDVSNKVANLASGGGIDFIAGFGIGLLEGLIDGIIDPFRLIFLLGQVLVTTGNAIGQALAPLALQAIPGYEEPVLRRIDREPSTTPSVPGTPGAARGPPASPLASYEPEPILQSVEPTDADVAASLGPQTVSEFPATDPEGPIDAEAGLEQARAATQSRGATVSGLGDLLGDAWDAILAGAASIGAAIAGGMLRFILLPDFQFGRKLGFVGGFVLFQALVIYLSAGGYAALKAVEPGLRQLLIFLLRFLDLGGELFALLGRALKPLKGPILSGLARSRASSTASPSPAPCSSGSSGWPRASSSSATRRRAPSRPRTPRPPPPRPPRPARASRASELRARRPGGRAASRRQARRRRRGRPPHGRRARRADPAQRGAQGRRAGRGHAAGARDRRDERQARHADRARAHRIEPVEAALPLDRLVHREADRAGALPDRVHRLAGARGGPGLLRRPAHLAQGAAGDARRRADQHAGAQGRAGRPQRPPGLGQPVPVEPMGQADACRDPREPGCAWKAARRTSVSCSRRCGGSGDSSRSYRTTPAT